MQPHGTPPFETKDRETIGEIGKQQMDDPAVDFKRSDQERRPTGIYRRVYSGFRPLTEPQHGSFWIGKPMAKLFLCKNFLAEEEGFEPPVPSRVQRFSSAFPAATPAVRTRLIPTEERFSGRRPGSCRVPSAPVDGQRADKRVPRGTSSLLALFFTCPRPTLRRVSPHSPMRQAPPDP